MERKGGSHIHSRCFVLKYYDVKAVYPDGGSPHLRHHQRQLLSIRSSSSRQRVTDNFKMVIIHEFPSAVISIPSLLIVGRVVRPQSPHGDHGGLRLQVVLNFKESESCFLLVLFQMISSTDFHHSAVFNGEQDGPLDTVSRF